MRTALLSKIEASAGLGSLSAFGALSVQVEGRQIEEVIVTAQRSATTYGRARVPLVESIRVLLDPAQRR